MEFRFIDLNSALRKHLVPLRDALDFQEKVLGNFKSTGRTDAHYVAWAEHIPVYTHTSEKQGRTLIRPGPESLRAPLVKVERAGSITFHGPGQIVYYLILILDKLALQKSIAEYIDEIVIKTLAHFGIHAEQKPHHLPEDAGGTWFTYCGIAKKIASRGITIKHFPSIGYVTTFGFALNVNTDLSFFDCIYPCGLPIEMTSMRQVLGSATPLREVAKQIHIVIRDVFEEKAPSL